MKKILQSLIEVQQKLNAPKDKYNNFGKYTYRSLEGIEEAIKPILKELGCGIYFMDEVVDHCGRTFLKTTLTFFTADGETISTTAEAEHAATKSGMDQSQITGAASSYARKYAMNALFAIDDNKDADTDEFHNSTNQVAPVQQKKAAKKSPVVQNPPVNQPLEIKYASIWEILKNLTTIDNLLAYYKEHKEDVEGNPEIKTLFGMRKNEIKNNKTA